MKLQVILDYITEKELEWEALKTEEGHHMSHACTALKQEIERMGEEEYLATHKE